jgi:hypothetical protein
MVVAVMVKEEYEIGGQNLHKIIFCYTDNTKKCIQNVYKLNGIGSEEPLAVAQRYGKYKDQS